METNNYNIDDIQKNIRSALDIISEQSKGIVPKSIVLDDSYYGLNRMTPKMFDSWIPCIIDVESKELGHLNACVIPAFLRKTPDIKITTNCSKPYYNDYDTPLLWSPSNMTEVEDIEIALNYTMIKTLACYNLLKSIIYNRDTDSLSSMPVENRVQTCVSSNTYKRCNIKIYPFRFSPYTYFSGDKEIWQSELKNRGIENGILLNVINNSKSYIEIKDVQLGVCVSQFNIRYDNKSNYCACALCSAYSRNINFVMDANYDENKLDEIKMNDDDIFSINTGIEIEEHKIKETNKNLKISIIDDEILI